MKSWPLLVFLALFLSGCGGFRDPARDPAVLVRIAEDEPKGLDPQAFSDLASTRIAAEQFEGLTRFDASGNAEPGLASTWQTSADGLAWTFPLRPGLRFSDEAPISAQTFQMVFKRLVDPATNSPLAGLFGAIAAVDAVQPNTVRVRLKAPFPALPELLAHPAMAALPLHRTGWVTERPLAVSGAYRLEEWALNDRLRFSANPAWHGGKPPIRKVEWRPVAETLSALRLFQSGGADVAGDVPSSRLPKLKQTMSRSLRIAPYLGSYYFVFNTRKPPFNDARLRQALSLAVERRWLAERLIGSGVTPAWGVVPPGTSGLEAYSPKWADWPREKRLAEARALLARAGYGPGRPLRFDIRFNSDTDHRRVAVSLASMWRPLGVEAALLNTEASLHFASLRRSDFALARSGWIGDIAAPENFLAIHLSDAGPVNYTGFADPEFDRLLEKAGQISDASARAKTMRQAEMHLMERAVVLPLYYYVSKSLVSSRVKGWRDNPANIHPSRTLRIE